MRKSTRRRSATIGLGAALVPLIVTASAGSSRSAEPSEKEADPPPPVVELLSRGAVTQPFDAESYGIELEADRRIDVAVARVTFEPGASPGWHRHPGPTVVTVTMGELTLTDRKCESRTFEAGEVFVEPGPRLHLAVNTADSTTELIITFFARRDAELLTIPAEAPACAG